MRGVVGRVSRGVSYEGGNVDANQGEVVKVEAPSPYACTIESVGDWQVWADRVDRIPITTIKATRYGRGNMRLNLSSPSSTAGSPSSMLKLAVALVSQGVGLRSHSWEMNE